MGVVPVFSLADLVGVFTRLLPPGRIWPRRVNPVMVQTFAPLLMRYYQLTQDAANEPADSFPSTTVTSLPSWESALGLPDPCDGPDPTIATRQAHVVARLVYSGGQSIPYFIDFAAQIGHPITITEYAPARAGKTVAGGPCNGPAWASAWTATTSATTLIWAKAGTARAGDPINTFGGTVLECELRRISPAHTILMIAYTGGGAALWDGAPGWNAGTWSA